MYFSKAFGTYLLQLLVQNNYQMKQDKKYYGDVRLNHICAFCGGLAETEDHVPSRCFLDKPHPKDLPVIPCCYKCNHDFSLDEEYVSCAIDCMKAFTTSPSLISREKTRKSLIHNPKLQERISLQMRDFGGIHLFDIEKDRFKKVFRKLAFGHLAFENDTLSWESPYRINIHLLTEMSDLQREYFFRPFKGELLPEVCSHSLEHVVLCYEDGCLKSFNSPWITIQKDRYRYCVSPDGSVVKFVIAEFLAVEVSIEITL